MWLATYTEGELMNDHLLTVKNLKKYFPISKGEQKGKSVKAIDGISFTIDRGETLGLVGESGSGKSTTAYCVVGMYGITDGEVRFKEKDISMVSAKRSLKLKKEIQIVFQDPGTTLNPQRNIRQILSLPLSVHKMLNKSNPQLQLLELLDAVELPREYLYKYPMNLGGGERQMLAIARALTTNPDLIVLDEPTSALDVSVQAKIINMLQKIQKERNLSYLFITHDLSLMRNFADRVAIMYLGRIAEIAPVKMFFTNPCHPYTKMLLSSIPVIGEDEEVLKQNKVESRGEIPSPVNMPTGCNFHTRCPSATEKCKTMTPEMVEVAENHFAACHLLNQGIK